MSINKKRRSNTEGNRALELFTNCDRLIHVFASYIHDDSAVEKILFFHGDGGNGKSLLMKFLRQKCCKRFRTGIWQNIKSRNDAKAAYIEHADSWGTKSIPAVLHDFGLRAGADKPQDPFDGLLMLRRNLGREAKEQGYPLHFPLYDFACVWYLNKKHKLSKEEWEKLFPEEELELVLILVDAFNKTAFGQIVDAVWDIVYNHYGTNFYVFWQQRGLNKEDLEEIKNWDIDRELIDELPRLFAQDLNTAMSQKNTPQKIVLFFDTHEAFWGVQEKPTLQGYLYFAKDEWFRYLLVELKMLSGIVVVVAGREQPKWEFASKHPIAPNYLDAQLVDSLSNADAKEYLESASITNSELQQSIITYASIAVDRVHPLLLGLCADTILQNPNNNFLALSSLSFEDKARNVIDRLLSYINRETAAVVRALSACRAFDDRIYKLLSEELNFQATDESFNILTEFSFVWKVEQRGSQWYRIHDLVRRFNYELQDEKTHKNIQKAHTVLENYYRQKNEVAEAIYHANRLDWKRGVDEWVKEFDAALKKSRYEQCRALLEIRSELI